MCDLFGDAGTGAGGGRGAATQGSILSLHCGSSCASISHTPTPPVATPVFRPRGRRVCVGEPGEPTQLFIGSRSDHTRSEERQVEVRLRGTKRGTVPPPTTRARECEADRPRGARFVDRDKRVLQVPPSVWYRRERVPSRAPRAPPYAHARAKVDRVHPVYRQTVLDTRLHPSLLPHDRFPGVRREVPGGLRGLRPTP